MLKEKKGKEGLLFEEGSERLRQEVILLYNLKREVRKESCLKKVPKV